MLTIMMSKPAQSMSILSTHHNRQRQHHENAHHVYDTVKYTYEFVLRNHDCMPTILMIGVTLVVITVRAFMIVMDRLVSLAGMFQRMVSMFIIMIGVIMITAIIIMFMESVPMIVVMLLMMLVGTFTRMIGVIIRRVIIVTSTERALVVGVFLVMIMVCMFILVVSLLIPFAGMFTHYGERAHNYAGCDRDAGDQQQVQRTVCIIAALVMVLALIIVTT